MRDPSGFDSTESLLLAWDVNWDGGLQARYAVDQGCFKDAETPALQEQGRLIDAYAAIANVALNGGILDANI